MKIYNSILLTVLVFLSPLNFANSQGGSPESQEVSALYSQEATEPEVRLQVTNSSNIYWTLYSDNGGSVIDVIEEKNGEAQQVVKSWRFSDFQKAKLFFEEKTKNFNPLRSQILNSQVQSVKSLSGKKLWNPVNNWSWDWELKYAKWIAENVDKSFMQKHQIPSDCADLAYILRWIFARNNSLPVAARLSSTGKFMTHETVLKEWENLKTHPEWSQDQLFRAALRYLTRQTYTHTLMRDSYPIAINPESVTEGVYHLQLRENSGHTMLIYKVDRTGGVPLRVLYSNLPIEIRELYESIFSELDWPIANQRALLRFRWPQKSTNGWSLVPSSKMPYFSEEQFGEDLKNSGASFFVAAFKRVSPSFNPLNVVEENLKSLFSQLENRVQVVEEGYRYCSKNDCSPGTTGDADWSTPSRDRRLRETYQALYMSIELFKDVTGLSTIPDSIMSEIKNFKVSIANQELNFVSIYARAMLELMESDPRVSIEQRWASTPESIRVRIEKILQEEYLARDAKIKKDGPCKGDECNLSSEAWIAKSTLQEDLNIAQIIRRLQSLCSLNVDDCQELNRVFKSSQSFKEYFSRAVTQHSSASSALDLRLGSRSASVSFTPGLGKTITLAPNIFLQSRVLFEQSSEDVFPLIKCDEALLNTSAERNVVCIHPRGENIRDFCFLNEKMQTTDCLEVEMNENLDTYYWIEDSNLFAIFYQQKIKVFSAQGQLLSEIDLPGAYQSIGRRWILVGADKSEYQLLDLANINKGWVLQKFTSPEIPSHLNVVVIKDKEHFLYWKESEIFVLNEKGEQTDYKDEILYRTFDDKSLLVTKVAQNKETLYKFYRFDLGVYRYLTEVKVPLDVSSWSLFRTRDGFFYGNDNLGYSLLNLNNLKQTTLSWTQGKLLYQFNEDGLVMIDPSDRSAPRLYDFNGNLMLKNRFLYLEKDRDRDLNILRIWAGNSMYTQTFKGLDLNTPVHSSSGFYLISNLETDENSENVQMGSMVQTSSTKSMYKNEVNTTDEHSFQLGILGGRGELSLLRELGIQFNTGSILLKRSKGVRTSTVDIPQSTLLRHQKRLARIR